ncbi:prostaglandin E receptor 1a (subtype EP1) [Trichomycterus rosablanca]|uniref:prostaglandin E receptor 1a (subtype EP1) n=1 Tax=Trichomycterus rosablanca TaxID=2290929 RepID=UPI002F360116
MTLGIVSNMAAMIILVKLRSRPCMRRRSRAFLLLATSLVVTDFLGHAILGSIVLKLYVFWDGSVAQEAEADALCHFLGGSMVFFGLSSLFMGSLMAAERSVGITRPLLHASLVSGGRAKLAVVMIWLVALCVALMPGLGVGTYTYQYPGTWCFIRVLQGVEVLDVVFVLMFSSLAFGSLGISLLCNIVSGLTLLAGRIRPHPCNRHHSKSHDIEMVVQLVGFMLTSCICWSPLLVLSVLSVTHSYGGHGAVQDGDGRGYDGGSWYEALMVKSVRLASWNQILDPWVYILLRRSVLYRLISIITRTHREDLRETSMFLRGTTPSWRGGNMVASTHTEHSAELR